MRYKDKAKQELYVKAVMVFQSIITYGVILGDYDKDSDWNLFLDDLHNDAVEIMELKSKGLIE